MSDVFSGLALLSSKFLAGLAGSVVSLRFIPGAGLSNRLIYVASGSGCAYYLGAPVATYLGTPHEPVGFVLGLFGMSVADAVAGAIRSTPWGDILSRRLGGGQ